MAINPMAMLKYRENLEKFNQDHPRVLPFLNAVHNTALVEGTVLELKAVTPDGRELITNFRLNENDVETLRMLREVQ